MKDELRCSVKRKITTWLFNPFKYVAGIESFLVGALAITLTGYLASFSNTHFDGVLDTHSGLEAPLWCYVAEGWVNWLCAVVVFLLFGRLASKSSFRLIDLMGTQAMARWPLVFTAIAVLSEKYESFTKFLMWKLTGQGELVLFNVQDAVGFSIIVFIMLIMTGWMVFLMYRSFSLTCNLRGGMAIGTFAGALIVAEIISKVAMAVLILPIQCDDGWKPVDQNKELANSAERKFQHIRYVTFSEGAEAVNVDKGLTVEGQNGEFRIHGKTTDKEWRSDAVKIRIDDAGGDLDISGSFRLAQKTASGLVFLEAQTENGGSIIIMYQWGGLFKAYQIQSRWFKIPAKIVNNRRNLGSRGDEETAFNKMRIYVRTDRRHVDLYINDEYFDTVEFEESFGRILSAKMALQSPEKDASFDIRFNDFNIQWNDSSDEKHRVEMEKKTGVK